MMTTSDLSEIADHRDTDGVFGSSAASSSSSSSSFFFQPLSFGGTLLRMIRVYKMGFGTFHKIMFVLGGTYVVLWASMLLILPPLVFGLDPEMLTHNWYRNENAFDLFCLFLIQSCVALCFATIGHGAIIRITTDIYLSTSLILPLGQQQSQQPPHQQVELEELEVEEGDNNNSNKHSATTSTRNGVGRVRSYLAVGVRYFCPNLLASILIFFGVCLGLVLLVLPGIYVAFMWIMTHIAIVTEGFGAYGGLKRSWNLVKGHWCYVFCVKFVMMFPFTILNQLWMAYVAPNMFTFWGFVIGVIPYLFIAPFLSILVTVMYINLSVQKEGLDAQALAAADGRRVGNTVGVEPQMEQGSPVTAAGVGGVEGVPDFA